MGAMVLLSFGSPPLRLFSASQAFRGCCSASVNRMATTTPKPPADGVRGSEPETFDAILVVAFGGPEGMDDVMPFLENVTRGRSVPPERLEEVAHHYERFDGVSPIN